MPQLDLRNVTKLTIYCLENKLWSFSINAAAGAPSFAGATALMTIKNTAINRTLTVGSGITVTSNKITVSTTGLVIGTYNYNLEVTAVTGEIIRVIDKIIVTNE